MASKKYNYADEKSIQSIDEVLSLADKVLDSESVVINDERVVPPIVGAALTGVVGAGATGAVGTAALLGEGALVAGGAAALGTVLLPVAALASIGYLIFKSNQEKKLHNMRLSRYKVAVEKQNKAINKFMELDKEREANEKKYKDDMGILKKENNYLRNKINEVRAINESLLQIIRNLSADIQID
ncbi:MAG: hypothetical protein ABRQ27_17365 [Clostridiaceae bacterium]